MNKNQVRISATIDLKTITDWFTDIGFATGVLKGLKMDASNYEFESHQIEAINEAISKLDNLSESLQKSLMDNIEKAN